MTIITSIYMGRSLTDSENQAKASLLETDVSEGTTDGTCALAPTPEPGKLAIRIWTTTDAANSWVALFNTFTPAPVSSQVLTV